MKPETTDEKSSSPNDKNPNYFRFGQGGYNQGFIQKEALYLIAFNNPKDGPAREIPGSELLDVMQRVAGTLLTTSVISRMTYLNPKAEHR